MEISGSAYGRMSYVQYDRGSQEYVEEELFRRPAGQERTFHRLGESRLGGKLRFENDAQETPIGELGLYQVSTGSGPQGMVRLSYTLTGQVEPDNRTLHSSLEYIDGRFMPDERTVMIGLPAGAPASAKRSHVEKPLPLIHIVVPFDFRLETHLVSVETSKPEEPSEVSELLSLKFRGKGTHYSYTWEGLNGGLDGIVLELPALKVAPTHGDFFPLNIQVKDPLWPDRNLVDFSFSVKPGEAQTLWLDSRDRILPDGYPLYLTLAGAGQDFGPKLLEGTRLHLVFKNRHDAAVEHELDRMTQVRDNFGNIVEWKTNNKNLRLSDRASRDLKDLLRVNGAHEKGRAYWSFMNPEQGWPEFIQPKPPEDVPLWAFRQVELVHLLRHFIHWWIDNRQIEGGGFGGGLSDDSDLTHLWIGAALMGIDPPRLAHSVEDLLEAIYSNGMFTNGLNTIMADQLHAYEEGINVQPQVMQLKWGDPKTVERMMETSKALERITGISHKSHRHIRSSYYSATRISLDPVWARVKLNSYSHLILHPALMLVNFNGHPKVQEFILEVADGILDHRSRDAAGNFYLPGEILFPSCEEEGTPFTLGWRTALDVTHLFWAAWRWTGEEKYLLPIWDSVNQEDQLDVVRYLSANVMDQLNKRDQWKERIMDLSKKIEEPMSLLHSGYSRSFVEKAHFPTFEARSAFLDHLLWQLTGNKGHLEDLYGNQIQQSAQRMPLYTEDHWWSDQVGIPSSELQRSRLGGIAALRMITYPGHLISWRFREPARAESVAILVPGGDSRKLKVIAFNLEEVAVEAEMTAWQLDPGMWKLTMGIDRDGDHEIDEVRREETVRLERSRSVAVRFVPKQSTILELELVSESQSQWQRPDLGIGRDDLRISGDQIEVTVHSLGSVPAPAGQLVLEDRSGRQVAAVEVPALEAPLDLEPRTAVVTLPVPAGAGALSGYSVRVELAQQEEITERNNRVVLQ